ncbi:uncharacterized protein [Epargyreus clarus]|uniref:uncharacterized protein n=1 Tax=Epargyreus clarus TaxID=520877 RepID=UPI003C2F8C1D
MGGWAGSANGVLGAEMCAPLLLLCWLCCWPDDNSDSSSEKYPQKPIISIESTSRRRTNDLFRRRFGSSAVSLHTPSTSGHTKQPLSAHRSHEEIRSRRKSHHENGDQETRYHSAPSVIDEVLHRRDWERSSKDLYIPLKPNNDDNKSISSNSSRNSFDDTSSVLERPAEPVARTCKKHYTNIKSSKKTNTKESNNEDIKDQDVTENPGSSFYIGDTNCQLSNIGEFSVIDNEVFDVKSGIKAKETKQSLNECIRSKDRPKTTLVPLAEFQVSNGFDVEDIGDIVVDRSGAVHHSIESRSSLFGTHAIPFPPPSVEAVGYESDASYLEDGGVPASPWRRGSVSLTAAGRARHASVGDVLAPSLTLRPQSGALSESDLDFELEGCDEPPPAYDEVQLLASIDRKETAI